MSEAAKMVFGRQFRIVTVAILVASACGHTSTRVAHASPNRSQVEAFSGDGASVVTSVLRNEPANGPYSEQLEVWDVATGKSRFRLPKVIGQGTLEASLSPNGRYLAVGRYGAQSSTNSRQQNQSGEWSLWDVQEKRLIRSGVVGYGWVGQVAFSPDGQQFAVASQHQNSAGQYDRTQVWMILSKTGKTLRTYLPGWSTIYSLTFSPDGHTLGLCGEVRPGRIVNGRSQPPQGMVQLWDAHSERLLRTFVEVDSSVFDLKFSPQSDRIVYRRDLTTRSDLDARLSLAPSETAESIRQRSEARKASLLEKPVVPMTALDMAKANPKLDMVMWDLRTGQCVLWQSGSEEPGVRVEIDRARFSFSSDGRTLSCLMRSITPDPKYPPNSGYIETRWVVRSWNLVDAIFDNPAPTPPSRTIPLEESRLIDRPRFSPEGSKVAAPSLTTQIYFWDSATGRLSGKSWDLAQ